MDGEANLKQYVDPGAVMGWIVQDANQRLHAEIGHYRWDEWRAAIDALGLEVVIVCRQKVPTACLRGNTIYIGRGQGERETAYLAFHEAAHAVLHAGTPDVWRELPGGVHLINKFERQANEFAETFPIWEEP